LLGYIRDLLIAFFFGANFETDAFYVAFRIPNLFRRLLAEGTLSSTLVPFFTEANKASDKTLFKELRNHIFTIVFVLLFFTTLVFYFFSEEIILFFAFGFDSESRTLSADLLKRMAPFLFLISLSALNMGLLNSLKKFNPPAFSPVFMNIGIIATILSSYWFFSLDIYVLSYAVLFGALLQYIFQVPFILKNNLGYTFDFKKSINSKTSLILKVIFPQVFGLAIYNLNILINTQFASFLDKGSITYLYLAERLIEFPLGIFAVSIATISLPDFANLYMDKKFEKFTSLINEKMKFLFYLTIPFATFFVITGESICNVLYARGEFNNLDAYLTYQALLAYSFGLVFVAGVRLLTQAFYAMKNTKTPVSFAAINLLINLILCYVLGFYFNLGFFGLALASSISSLFLFLFLFVGLRNIFKELQTYNLILFFLIILFISIISITFSSWLVSMISPISGNLISLVLTIIFSAIVFLIISKLLKIKELKMIFN
jgi:putative peptidoglycan lipid II flippase